MRRSVFPLGLVLAAFTVSAARAAPNQDGPLSTVERQFDAGNYAPAINSLQAILKQNPQDAKAYYWLGRCYYELGEYDQAIAQEESAVKLNTWNSDYHLWLGRAYGEKADRERSFFLARKVRHEFEEAVRINPGSIQARRHLMEYYAEAPWIVGGSKDDARGQADAIAALDPLEGHLARADLWRELKKPELAEAEYRWVMNAKPNRVEPYLEVAEFYQRQNNAAGLEGAVEAAARENPSDPRLAYFRGVARVIGDHDPTQGEQYLKAYLASTPSRSDWPSHAAAREWLGKLYEKEGKRMDAAEQYRAALHIDPGRKEAKERLERLEKGSK